MPSTACANNSVDLTTVFHECAISGISLTPWLFTCLISLTPQSLTHIKHIPVAKFDSFKQREKKKCLTSKFIRNGVQQSTIGERQTLCGRGWSISVEDEFSNYVNGKMASPRKVGKALADDHRYLVNEKAKLMFYFMEQLAENWHKGRYDQRNEWACRLAAEAIDHLAENDLYHLPEEYYENHKQ